MKVIENFDSAYLLYPDRKREELLKLAEEYHERTESFDCTVCTGRIRNGSIMPSNGEELGIINHNAKKIRQDILRKAFAKRLTEKELQEAIADYHRK